MTYNKNVSISKNNIVVISGSQIQATGSLYGSVLSGTTGQFVTLTGSFITGSSASFTTISASNFNVSGGNVVLTQTDISLGDNAYIDYNSSIDKLVLFPGLYITGALTASTSVSASNVAATSAVFTVLTGSTVTGSTARFTELTASNLTGSTALFTSVTASHSGSGAGLYGIPTTALTANTVTVGTTSIALGGTSTIIQGLTELTSSVVTGSTAKFTTVTASIVTGTTAQFTQLTASSVTGSEFNVDFIDFNTGLAANPAFQSGRLYYDVAASDLQYNSIVSGISFNLGQQLVVRVKNNTSTTINKGKLVRINGGIGNNPTITTASWENDQNSANTLGMLMGTLTHNEVGYVLLTGVLIGVDTSTFAAGDILYLSSSGDYTNITPVAPKHTVRLGEVVRVGGSDVGSIFVRIDNGYELEELHNVSASSPANGDLLVYDSAVSLWKNSKTLNGAYNLTGLSNIQTTSLTASNALFTNDILVMGTASIAQLNTLNQTSLNIGDKYITILTGSSDHITLDGSGFLWGSSSVSGTTHDDLNADAHVRYDAGRDKLRIFPGLFVSGGTGVEIADNLVVTGSTTLSTISGTTAQFVVVTASFTGSGAGLYSIPVSGLAANTVTVGSTSIILGGTATIIQGLTELTSSVVTGTTAQFTTITGSRISASSDITTAGNLVVNGGQISSSATVLTLIAGTTVDVKDNTIISGNLTVTGSIVELSTRRIKTNIETINNQLDTLYKLNPVSYNRIDDGRKEYGFISEEVKQVYPEFVVGEGINYPKMVSVLVSAVKELTEKLEKQQLEIELIKNNRGI
jgi:pSer/pThr/pTyr-binding forkhead associated (FHA) protein